jgi:bacterioferritin-associated ferredoxin
MYVCLCRGVTSSTIQEAIDAGAKTTKDVERMCGAGSVCGRCRHNVRLMLAASGGSTEPPKRILRRWGR